MIGSKEKFGMSMETSLLVQDGLETIAIGFASWLALSLQVASLMNSVWFGTPLMPVLTPRLRTSRRKFLGKTALDERCEPSTVSSPRLISSR